MFERFTDRARRTLTLAQEEARVLGHGFIGTEHILLGLLHEGEGVAATVLSELGVTLVDVRREVELILGGPPAGRPPASPPFTPRAKKVMELALREALQLGHSYIGTEHLLLGVVREGEGVAVQVLVALDATPARVREAVLRAISGTGDPSRRARRARGPFRRFPGQYAPLSFSEAEREAQDTCSLCGRDLWEVAHYVEGEGIRVCEHCIRAAADVLSSAGSERRALALPPRVFGDPPDPGSVDELVMVVLAVVGPPEERGRRASVVEGAQALEAHLSELDARLTGWARVSRIRFVSPDAADVRFHFRLVDEDEVSATWRVARVDGRWVVPRAAVADVMARTGIRGRTSDS